MIVNFKNFNLITEDPDHVWDDEKGQRFSCDWDEARAFTVDTNKDRTEVENMYFGPPGGSHGQMRYQGKNRSFPGRIWLESKILAFWVYPNDQLFKSIIKRLEEEFNIKIMNNGWRIEVQKTGDEIKKKDPKSR